MTLSSIEYKLITEETLPFTPLQQALYRCGVKILDEDGVKEYQAEKLKAKRREIAAERAWINWGDLLMGFGVAFAASVSVGFLTALPWRVIFPAALLTASTLSLLCLWHDIKNKTRNATRLLEWRRYFLGVVAPGYKLERILYPAGVPQPTIVPPECRALCASIAKEFTGSEYACAHLEQLDEDPFVYLVEPGSKERYYIFAWDEEGYVPR